MEKKDLDPDETPIIGTRSFGAGVPGYQDPSLDVTPRTRPYSPAETQRAIGQHAEGCSMPGGCLYALGVVVSKHDIQLKLDRARVKLLHDRMQLAIVVLFAIWGGVVAGWLMWRW